MKKTNKIFRIIIFKLNLFSNNINKQNHKLNIKKNKLNNMINYNKGLLNILSNLYYKTLLHKFNNKIDKFHNNNISIINNL